MKIQSALDHVKHRSFSIDNTKGNSGHNHLFVQFGKSGVGKTYSISTLPEKTLLIDIEGGSASLSDFDIDIIKLGNRPDGSIVPEVERYEQLKDIYMELKTPEMIEKYDNIVFDSLTEVSNIILAKNEAAFPNSSDKFKLYGEVKKNTIGFFKAAKDLTKFYNVIFLALSEEDKNEVGARINNIMLNGSSAQIIPSYADFVFYQRCYQNEVGEFVREVCTVSDGTFIAKSRSQKLSPTEVPDWSSILGKIK